MENVKGFKDFIGEEAKKRQIIKEILTKNFKLYGFQIAETPIIEYEEFVKGNNTNDEVISDIFKLQDKGKRNLALRYEFTFQLKRISQNKKTPYKRYQIGEVFRDEPISSNRFRQFTQCDADIIGSNIKDEAEILSLISTTLQELGIKATINVNNRKILNEILDKEGIKNKEQVIKEIDKLDKLPEKEIKSNLKKYKAEKILSIFKKPESYFKKYSSYKEIEELKKYCNTYKIKINFQPNLARGLSYYNSTIFEIKSKDMKETICAGGSYIINNIQSTGFSFGLERLSQLVKIKSDEKSVLIISINQDKEAIKLANELRKNKIPCNLMYGKPSKALEYANSYNIQYVIFLGQEEIKAKKFKLKNMITGKEQMLKKEELIKKI
jgi:histidyl-tRNA synthetase